MKILPLNDSGEKYYLTEDCTEIKINKIIRHAKKDIKEVLVKAHITASGFEVNIIKRRLHHGGERFWFMCPICKLSVGIIYRHPLQSESIGCRKCLKLTYRSRRYKGMLEENLST